MAWPPTEWKPENGARAQELKAKLTEIDVEVKRIDDNIVALNRSWKGQLARKTAIQRQLEDLNASLKSKSKQSTTNYFMPRDWTPAMKRALKEIFDIENFCLAQEGCVAACYDLLLVRAFTLTSLKCLQCQYGPARCDMHHVNWHVFWPYMYLHNFSNPHSLQEAVNHLLTNFLLFSNLAARSSYLP
jgi:hypothetical protein